MSIEYICNTLWCARARDLFFFLSHSLSPSHSFLRRSFAFALSYYGWVAKIMYANGRMTSTWKIKRNDRFLFLVRVSVFIRFRWCADAVAAAHAHAALNKHTTHSLSAELFYSFRKERKNIVRVNKNKFWYRYYLVRGGRLGERDNRNMLKISHIKFCGSSPNRMKRTLEDVKKKENRREENEKGNSSRLLLFSF